MTWLLSRRKRINDSGGSDRILYVQYTNPCGYPPLEHSSRILADAGWEVMFLGTGAFGANDLHFPSHSRITVRRMNYCQPGYRQKLHYVRYCLWVLTWTIFWRPRVIYASDPLSSPIALALTCVSGLRIIYHEHDSPNINATGESSSRFTRLVLFARSKLAQRAECCVLPNEQRVVRFQESTGRRRDVFSVWNCPAKEEVSTDRSSFEGSELWLLYHGSITPPRLPTTVLEAMAVLPASVKLRVIGYETAGSVGYVRTLQRVAHQLGISNRVHILKAIPRVELLKWCRKSDVGLMLLATTSDDINMRAMTGASNKVFDYLACGVALLVSESPEWRATFVEPGYGLGCTPDDPDSIGAALRWFLAHPDDLRAMGKRGQQRVATDWNYHNQFTPVLQCLSQTIQQ